METGACNTPFDRPIQESVAGFGLPMLVGILGENVGGCGKAGKVVIGEGGTDAEAAGKMGSGTELCCDGYMEIGIW